MSSVICTTPQESFFEVSVGKCACIGWTRSEMRLSQARSVALRLTLPQNVQITSQRKDRLVFPTAFLLAGLGVGVSSFSVKQLLSAKRVK